MSGHGEKLTRKQETAIAALLCAATVCEAASRAGVGEATLFRWLKRPEFQTAYRDARRAIVECAIAELQAVTSQAVSTLRRNLTSGNPSVEVRAAQVIIAEATKAVELMDLVERVEVLERR